MNYDDCILPSCSLAKVPGAHPTIPSADGHGCTVDVEAETKAIDWMGGIRAPSAVLELLSRQCKKVCNQDCPCVCNNKKCTDMRRLQNCNNCAVDNEPEESSDAVDLVVDVYSDVENETYEEYNDSFQQVVFCTDVVEELEVDSMEQR